MNSIYVKGIIPIEFCHFYTHVLMRSKTEADDQVPTALSVVHHDVMFETLQERIWGVLEDIISEELLPTYAYSRLYSNGDVLEKHKDRPACEVSITIQLGRSHHYAWPIYMGNQRYDLAEGDGVIYSGCDVEHWRDVCAGPEGYYSGQLFLHYVRKNGKYANEFGDSTNREAPSFIKNRTYLMETK